MKIALARDGGCFCLTARSAVSLHEYELDGAFDDRSAPIAYPPLYPVGGEKMCRTSSGVTLVGITRMKTVSLAFMLTTMVAGPLWAQPAPYRGYDAQRFWQGTSINPIERIQILKDRVDRAEANGSIDPGEAHRVRDELSRTWEWIRRMHYEDGGHLYPGQRAEVQSRLDQISQQIHWLREDAWLSQPAPTQGYDSSAFWRGTTPNPIERIQILKDRVNRAEANGSIDPGEARRVRDELSHTWEWIHRMHYEDGGNLTPGQRAEVQGRLDQVSQQIRWLRHDGW